MNRIYIKTIIFLLIFLIGETAYAQNDTVNIHGFISQGYIQTDRNNYIADSEDGTFQFNEMAINFVNRPTDSLLIGVQFFARDFGNIDNDEITLDWAFADYRLYDWLGMRAGKIKNPVGLYLEVRDIDMLRTFITLPSSVYDENLRDTGMSLQGRGLYGDINTDSLGSFSYQVLSGTNNISSDGGTSAFVSSGRFDISDINLDTTYSFSGLWADPTGHVRMGASGYFTGMKIDAVSTQGLKYQGISLPGYEAFFRIKDVEYLVGSFEVVWESFVFSYEYLILNSKSTITLDALATEYAYESHILGYYGSASYRINNHVELGYYYSEMYLDKDDRDGSNEEKGLEYMAWHKESAFAVRCDINLNWIAKLEAHYIDGGGKLREELQSDGTKVDRYWWIYMAKLSYSF